MDRSPHEYRMSFSFALSRRLVDYISHLSRVRRRESCPGRFFRGCRPFSSDSGRATEPQGMDVRNKRFIIRHIEGVGAGSRCPKELRHGGLVDRDLDDR